MRSFNVADRDASPSTAQVAPTMAAGMSPDLFLAAMAATSDAFSLYDRNDVLVAFNDAYRALFGQAGDRVRLGMTFADILALQEALGLARPPDDGRASWTEYRRTRHRSGESRAPFEIERSDGRWLLVREQVLPDDTLLVVATDIGPLKAAEAAARASERKFRDLLDGSLQGVVVHRDGVIAYANETAAAMIGMHVDEVIGRPVEELIAPDDLPRLPELRALPVTPSFELRARRKDGSFVWLQARGRTIEWDGRPARQTTLIDIDARKTAETAQERLAAALDVSRDAYALFDADDRLVYANDAYRRFNPHVAAAIRPGIRFEDLLRESAATGAIADAVGQEAEWIARRTEHHRKGGGAMEVRLPSGWRRLMEHRLSDGCTFLVESDITEEKLHAAEREALLARLQVILDRMPFGCLLHDAQWRYTYWNPAAERLLGWRFEEVRGCTPFETTVPEERKADVEALFRSLEVGTLPASHVGSCRRRDGQTILCEWHDTPLFDADGGFAGSMAMFQDVTQREGMQEQLRQAQKMEAVGQLTGGIAHDFNNLLTVVLANADLLSSDLDQAPEQRALADAIAEAAERGAELTRNLLAFARRQTLMPRVVDVNAQLERMLSLMRRTLGEHIDIRLVPGARVPAAFADPAQLETAVLNLALNARDAMAGGGQLTFVTDEVTLDEGYASARQEVRPGRYVMIAVADSGEGMAPDVLARAFEPFFTTKEIGKGSGLGLSMVYGFASQSGGHVRIYSEPGHGTEVRLFLPTAARAPTAAEAPQAPSPAGRGETVLLVEDDDLVRVAIETQLAYLGYRVIARPEGRAALEALAQHPEVHLLLTDVVMPNGMNGRELAERALLARRDLAVLYMSGYNENVIVHQGRLDPGVRLLQKPFQRRELALKVRAALDARPGGS